MISFDFDKTLLQMDTDLEFINRTYGIISTTQKAKMLRDIKYVFCDNIAKEIKFVFYNQSDKNIIYFENVYHNDGRVVKTHPLNLEERISRDDLAFDVFIGFTNTFLALEGRNQDLLMGNTEHDWYA